MAKKVNNKRFDRAAFLSATTTLLEDVIPGSRPGIGRLLGLGDIPIRELTAAQRLEAVEVAKIFDAEGEEVTLPDGTAKLDTTKYWAALIQMSVLDPNTCYDGDTFKEGQGSLLLEPDDILTLSEQGKEALQALAQQVMNLSWLTRNDLFRSNPQTDDRQPPAGAGADTTGTDTEGMEPGNDGAGVGDEGNRVEGTEQNGE